MMDDTIAAISTPLGVGGLAVIRVSGPQAFAVADRIFRSRHGRPSDFPSHTLHFGCIQCDGAVLDQVMLAVLRRPHSYTGEDTVEISCHGGPLVAQSILGTLLRHGARLAEPGEFTKRAFLNGRLDLSQAESVMDLITARTARAQAAALRALEGQLGKQLERIYDQLITVLATVEAHIDFPDDELGSLDLTAVQQQLNAIDEQVRKLQAGATEGRILRHGFRVAIVGRPNVGKSSLMNALLGSDRAIVTAVPGTTRDSLEEYVNIRGIPVCLIDTAGLRRPRGQVETEGIRRTQRAIADADALLLVLDGSRRLTVADERLYEESRARLICLVINKIDLPIKLRISSAMSRTPALAVSAKEQVGLDELRRLIADAAGIGCVSPSEQHAVVNQRHVDILRRASTAIQDSLSELANNQPLEILAQRIHEAANIVAEITGRVTNEEMLSSIFSRFCIGK